MRLDVVLDNNGCPSSAIVNQVTDVVCKEGWVWMYRLGELVALFPQWNVLSITRDYAVVVDGS